MIRFFRIMVVAVVVLFSGFYELFSADKIEITISAAASLKDSLTDIKNLYEKENPGSKLIFNFGASGSLQQQIENGAPVDIFISAAVKQIDDLEKKGFLLNGSRITLLENSIVLIVPADSKLKGSFNLLSSVEVKKVAIGETKSVPVGQYSLEILNSLKINEIVLPKAVFAKDVREVLVWVETGNVDAGIVYKTDALVSKGKIRILSAAPAESHKAVIYPAAVIKESKNFIAAKAFLSYLKGKNGNNVFIKYGFIPVK